MVEFFMNISMEELVFLSLILTALKIMLRDNGGILDYVGNILVDGMIYAMDEVDFLQNSFRICKSILKCISKESMKNNKHFFCIAEERSVRKQSDFVDRS